MTRRPGGAASAADRTVGSATVVAGVVYSAFLVSPLTGSRLDPARSFVSELAALDQPHGFALRVVDAFVGLVLVVAGVHLWRGAGATRVVRWAGAALGLVGLATVADAAAPMSCAPSADPACASAEAARGALGLGVHEATSVVANGAALAVVALLAVARARGRTARGRVSPLEGVLFAGLGLIAVPGLLVVGEETVGLGLDAVVGLVQRVQVLALSAVLVVVGVVVARGSRWATRVPPPSRP